MESHCPNTTTGQSLVIFENRQSACNSITSTFHLAHYDRFVNCNFWAYLKIKETINNLKDQDDWSRSEETETSHSACESWWQCKQTVLYSLCIPINYWQYCLIFGKQIGNKMGDEHEDRELPKWWSSTEGTLKVATLDVRQTSTCIKQFN